MSLQIQDLSYTHPNRDILFQNISFSVSAGEKCAVVGNNGVGKSTLLKIIAGLLSPASGSISFDDIPYIIPQHFGQFDEMTVAQALGIEGKLNALSRLLDGIGSENDFETLDNEWDLQNRMAEAFARWRIDYICPEMYMRNLSGGEKTKVFLAGLDIFTPSIVLMDEPTNHLDTGGRDLLYDYISRAGGSLIVVSHDRTLLNLLPEIYEMSPTGMQFYPMGYDEYKATVDAAFEAKSARLESQRKEFAKAEKAARKTVERQQKHASRGEKQTAKKCVARIAEGNLRDQSESTTARLDKVQQEKLASMKRDLHELRLTVNEHSSIKIDLGSSSLHLNKRLVEIKNVTFKYGGRPVMWEEAPLNLTIFSGERIRIQGDNGSGKSTLLKLICGTLHPSSGELYRSEPLNILYLDQEYSCIDNDLTVYGQLEACTSRKPEHELKILLNRFLFTPPTWDKKCGSLSGGEKMKLALCRLLVCDNAPDLIIADEPTNNIDISSMDILAATLKSYEGTLLVVSHDEHFIRDVGIERAIKLLNAQAE